MPTITIYKITQPVTHGGLFHCTSHIEAVVTDTDYDGFIFVRSFNNIECQRGTFYPDHTIYEMVQQVILTSAQPIDKFIPHMCRISTSYNCCFNNCADAVKATLYYFFPEADTYWRGYLIKGGYFSLQLAFLAASYKLSFWLMPPTLTIFLLQWKCMPTPPLMENPIHVFKIAEEISHRQNPRGVETPEIPEEFSDDSDSESDLETGDSPSL